MELTTKSTVTRLRMWALKWVGYSECSWYNTASYPSVSLMRCAAWLVA